MTLLIVNLILPLLNKIKAVYKMQNSNVNFEIFYVSVINICLSKVIFFLFFLFKAGPNNVPDVLRNRAAQPGSSSQITASQPFGKFIPDLRF